MAHEKERFAESYEAVTETGCWLWTGTMLATGYGSFWNGKKNVRAHRYSYEHAIGNIPRRAVVCHKCDTPSCVNPDHLFVGRQSDNLQDCVAKGRKEVRQQSMLYRGVMTDGKANAIREARAAGLSNDEIAKQHGVSPGYCSQVARGLKWNK